MTLDDATAQRQAESGAPSCAGPAADAGVGVGVVRVAGAGRAKTVNSRGSSVSATPGPLSATVTRTAPRAGLGRHRYHGPGRAPEADGVVEQLGQQPDQLVAVAPHRRQPPVPRRPRPRLRPSPRPAAARSRLPPRPAPRPAEPVPAQLDRRRPGVVEQGTDDRPGPVGAGHRPGRQQRPPLVRTASAGWRSSSRSSSPATV